MADCNRAYEIMEGVAGKNLWDQSHPFAFPELASVRCDNTCTFLSTMLESVKAVVSEFCSVRMTENAEDSTIVFWIVLLHVAMRAERIPSKPHEVNGRNRKIFKFQSVGSATSSLGKNPNLMRESSGVAHLSLAI